MQETDLQDHLRERLGLRVGTEMARYLLKQAGTGKAGMIAVIGEDARTGLPLCRQVPADVLAGLVHAAQQAQPRQM